MEAGGRFFFARADYARKAVGLKRPKGVEVDAAKGLEATAFFARICQVGLCSYTDVASGRVTIQECFEMSLMVDWRNHVQAVAEENAKRE
jgi:hypothetical protein